MLSLLPYKEIWAVDFEFHPDKTPGGIQVPVCMVAKELRTGRVLRHWQDELREMSSPPFDIGVNSLFVAYLASAELHCHLSLGWKLPVNVFDCFTEFRTLTNGLTLSRGRGLIGALAWFKIDSLATEEKTHWRDLILSCGPWSHNDRLGILDYCQTDVEALDKLLPKLLRALSTRSHWLEHGLLRGRYMRAVAAMEYRGVPIDSEIFHRLEGNWELLKAELIARTSKQFDVFDGTTFKIDKFADLLMANNVEWPRTESGRLALDEETFRQQIRAYPWLAPIREVRDNLSKLRLSSLQVGSDGRNRTLLGVLGSKTGRNQPSNARFIFGPSAWLRSLVKPKPGMGLAYIDFGSQEVAIAAKLSNDQAMMSGYSSGDPYLDFAIRAGMAPPTATKSTHGDIRDQCKAAVLGTQYGMREKTLANRIGVPQFRAKQLLRAHQETYPQYWQWINDVTNFATINGYLDTVFGWHFQIDGDTRPTTIQNFLCQANGAEMLRIACIMAHEEGIKICAPVHDAILMEAPLENLERDVARLRKIMTEAGKLVLDGFPVRTDAEIIKYPERYMDKRGSDMWAMITGIFNDMGDIEP